jgi:hypothetical protein
MLDPHFWVHCRGALDHFAAHLPLPYRNSVPRVLPVGGARALQFLVFSWFHRLWRIQKSGLFEMQSPTVGRFLGLTDASSRW